MVTQKLYINEPYLKQCAAHVVSADMQGVILDQTVAFPASGGQAGDQGSIQLGSTSFAFTDTKKVGGRLSLVPELPAIQVATTIIHCVAPEVISYLVPGTLVTITIDVTRRAKLSVNHTGLHLVLMGLEDLRPNIAKFIKGCHITPEYARLDFFLQEKLTKEELAATTDFVNVLVAKDLPITRYTHSLEEEASFWHCLTTTYPCGGTHLPATRYVGNRVIVRRKSIGKALERITASFPNAQLPLNLFYQKEPL